MGGKGQRRREKNFLASHGSDSRLPPPPKVKELDALPSKLRKLLQFKNKPQNGDKNQPPSTSQSRDSNKNKRKRGNPDDAGEKFTKKGDKKVAKSRDELELEKGGDFEVKTSVNGAAKDALTSSDSSDKRKKKRRRKTVEDLRFQDLEQATDITTRKQRRKKFFKEKKKKHKKEKNDGVRDFPGHEKIKFGDIVEAPPKLNFPKAHKAFVDASKERARLQAIEAYRNRKGWESRPGLQLPSLAEAPSS